MRAHIEACQSCAAEIERLNRAMAAVEEMELVEPPPRLWHGVYDRITARQPQPRRDIIGSLIGRPRRALSLGLGIAALAGAVLFGISAHHPSGAGLPEPAAMEYVQGHAMAASRDAMADRVGLGFVVALPAARERDRR